ncbi:glycosyl transferase [Tersicoccus solisilvae]|uniref:Glycosyl transferase n=1 Tax=Tersicoccus solisilvae TaxID=1882339 RepID=A0ABQ1P7Z4_9MICC|nr:glycosyltransferase [Tersicoccus solisilvae]GGC92132.1 glycosyl transferase [Tersicoccus solisilvae]
MTAPPVHVVVVTYNRSGYLRGLLDSILALDPAPTGVTVVDNASTDDTPDVLGAFAATAPCPVVVERLTVNSGGAGGFRAGVRAALAATTPGAAAWLWLMDDDVVALPDAIGVIAPFLADAGAVHGRRRDRTGRPFFWQNRFNAWLGVPLPVPGDVFAHGPVMRTDVGCFEGMFLNRRTAERVGPPDGRFFLTWDDTMYGWLISRTEPVTYVDRYVLRKIRPQRRVDLGVRHLNDSSDLSRYHVMRNRGHVARYLQTEHRWSRPGFALGTALTAGKELARLLLVERGVRGVVPLWRGWRDSRAILHDPAWRPEMGAPPAWPVRSAGTPSPGTDA